MLPFPIVAMSDVIIGYRPCNLLGGGTLIGIEVKRVVDFERNFRQTVAEWLVNSVSSWFPCMQVCTALFV